MGEGYIGEIFNSVQGEGFLVGKRQVFVRFAGCSCRCVYCNSEGFRNPRPRFCGVEIKAGAARFRQVPNPLSSNEVIHYVERLSTPDVHSVSLTGGEPLQAGEFLVDVARGCKEAGFKTYLETNGADNEMMFCASPHLDFASIDVKLPDHGAVLRGEWGDFFREELKSVKVALAQGLKTFVKIVVLGSSKPLAFRRVCERLAKLGVPLVIQPVTPRGGVSAPSIEQLFRFSSIAAKAGIQEISIIPQMHKFIGVP